MPKCVETVAIIYRDWFESTRVRIAAVERLLDQEREPLGLTIDERRNMRSSYSLLFSEACRKEFGDMYEHLLAQLRGGQYPESADCVMGLRFVQEVVAAAMWRFNMPVGGSLEQFAREFDRLDEPGECRRLHEWARAARIP